MRYYETDAGPFVNQDPIGLLWCSTLYQFAPNTQEWINPLGESGYRLLENKAFFNSIGMKGKGSGRDSWTNG